MKDIEMKEPHHSKPAEVWRCMFCGSVGNLWFQCNCETMQRVNSGKLPRPFTRTIDGIPTVFLCDELREIAESAGVMPVHSKPVYNAPDSVDTMRSVDSDVKVGVDSAEKRKAYKREWIRTQRAAKRGTNDTA